jgi:hypothetical protein
VSKVIETRPSKRGVSSKSRETSSKSIPQHNFDRRGLSFARRRIRKRRTQAHTSVRRLRRWRCFDFTNDSPSHLAGEKPLSNWASAVVPQDHNPFALAISSASGINGRSLVASPRLNGFSSDSWDTGVTLMVCLVKDHVPKFPFVHQLPTF